MNLYYSNDEIVTSENNLISPKADMSMAFLPPEPLSRNIPEKISLSNYIRCPAFTDTIKNTYALKFPFSFRIKVNQATGEIESDNPDLVTTYFVKPTDNSGVVQMQLGTLFFADHSCIASQMHPYMHINSLTQNASVLQGEYDIGKWIRPINLAFIVNSKQKEVVYEFKRGDVYSYLRLYTDQKVRMYEFNNTPDIQQIIVRCLSLKFAKSQGNMPLKEVYSSFMRKKYNKLLLKLIKENKIGEL